MAARRDGSIVVSRTGGGADDDDAIVDAIVVEVGEGVVEVLEGVVDAIVVAHRLALWQLAQALAGQVGR